MGYGEMNDRHERSQSIWAEHSAGSGTFWFSFWFLWAFLWASNSCTLDRFREGTVFYLGKRSLSLGTLSLLCSYKAFFFECQIRDFCPALCSMLSYYSVLSHVQAKTYLQRPLRCSRGVLRRTSGLQLSLFETCMS